MGKEFDEVKQLIKDFNIEDHDKLKQKIINAMNRNKINVRLNKIKLKKLLSTLVISLQ